MANAGSKVSKPSPSSRTTSMRSSFVGSSGQVIEGTIALPPHPKSATETTESTDPRSPALEVVFPPSPPKRWGGEGDKVFLGGGLGSVRSVVSVAINPAAAYVAMASDLRDGGAYDPKSCHSMQQ